MRVFNPLRDPMCWHATEYRNDAPQLPKPVLTKTDFARRYKAGEFGNSSPTWDGIFDWARSIWSSRDALYHIRNRVAGGPTWYNVARYDMMHKWGECISLVDRQSLYISAMCPTERTLIQGEVMRCYGQLEFYFSVVKKPMRDALKEKARTAYGVQALMLLKRHLNTNSYEWLMHLLDVYPDHIVEITALDCCWGTEPGFNTLYWEVRKY